MVRYAGISNFVGWQTAQAATWQRAVRRADADRQRPGRVFAARPTRRGGGAAGGPRRSGLGCFPWSPLGRGVLTGQYRPGSPRGPGPPPSTSPGSSSRIWTARSRGVVEAVVRAADGLDLTPLQVALLWVRDSPGVTAPLLGARTAGQLAPALACEDAATSRPRSSPPWTTSPADRISVGSTPRRPRPAADRELHRAAAPG